MRTTIRKQPSSIHPDLPVPAGEKGTIHLWRSGGIGDLIFMEPAVRKLRALYPGRAIILHAPARYEFLAPLLGFTGFQENNSGRREGIGVDLHWSVEQHPGWQSLDRVSMWEDILGVPISDEPVRIDFGSDFLLLEQLPNRDTNKPDLSFNPFSAEKGLHGRCLPVPVINRVAAELAKDYNVVLLSGGEFPDGVDRDSLCWRVGASVSDFVRTVASCSRCVSVDTGGLYVAAAAGLPCLGIFEHVAPWLRTKRFCGIYSLYLRRPTCQCQHHGPCTMPEAGEAPCKLLDEKLVAGGVLHCASSAGSVYSTFLGRLAQRPELAVRVWGDGDKRTTDFSLRHALAGIDWHYGSMDDGSAFSLGLEAGDLVARKDMLKALSDLQEPGKAITGLPYDLRAHLGTAGIKWTSQ